LLQRVGARAVPAGEILTKGESAQPGASTGVVSLLCVLAYDRFDTFIRWLEENV